MSDQQEVTRVQNPFPASNQAPAGAALAHAAASREVAEAQAAMVMAKRAPRDPVVSMDRIINECSRGSLAEKAEYAYARGGQEITGPSIRLAEVLARGWGNIAAGTIEMSRSRDAQGVGFSECVAYAWDLETNYRDERRFQVRHWRDTRNGGYAVTDERDVYEMIANQGARRKRACILACIPGDVTEAAIEQCHLTLKLTVDLTPDRIKGMVEKFAADYSVTKEMIETRIQRRVESMTPAQFANLGRVYNSLKDGMSEPKDWFSGPAGEDGEPAMPTTAKGKLDEVAGKPTKGKKKPDAPPAEATETKPAETTPQSKPSGELTSGDVLAAIINAKTVAEVDEQLDLGRSFPEAAQVSIKQTAASKKKQLAGTPLFGED